MPLEDKVEHSSLNTTKNDQYSINNW